ncbi:MULTISPECIES: hypothetical protein [unclassified Mycobacterium]|uniref:hypothetical protein n=1 Tax=unclassified Mycobacterium TaxID=2642494 RepID=UPI000ADE6C9B|nr:MULTISPECIES: hypothetical protein [unclassified Mycobacterium]
MLADGGGLLNIVKQGLQRRGGVLGFLLGIAAVVVLVAACTNSAPTSRPPDVPLQTGTQSTFPLVAMGISSLSVDDENVLYLGGATGISTLAPGAVRPTPLNLSGYPTVSTSAVAPDGTLYFVTLDGLVQTVSPGSTEPKRLPFAKLQNYSDIAVATDGTIYLGDNKQNKLLKYIPGADSPTELPVTGVTGAGHVAIDAEDNLFVFTMGEIVKIAKDAEAAEPVDGGPEDVGGLAVDTAGNLYATDVKANTVSRMPAGGGEWAQLPFTGLQSPTHITVDRDGNVYVVHQGRELVRLAAK